MRGLAFIAAWIWAQFFPQELRGRVLTGAAIRLARRRTTGCSLASWQKNHSGYRLAVEPEKSNVSGGSKKHSCHSAASDKAPAFHFWIVGRVEAIMPPSAESKMSTTPARLGERFAISE